MWALMGPKDKILYQKSLILKQNHKIVNENIKGIKSKFQT